MKEKKLQIIKDALTEAESSYLSDYDLIQRFSFMIELTGGKKLAKIICNLPEYRKGELENINKEDMADAALEAFFNIIPIELFLEYREFLRSPVVKQMMSYYPGLMKEFYKLLKQKYILREIPLDTKTLV